MMRVYNGANVTDNDLAPYVTSSAFHSYLRYFIITAVFFALSSLSDVKAQQPNESSAKGNGFEKAITQVATPALLDALKDNDKYVRLYAACALGKIKPEVAVPELIDALKDYSLGTESNRVAAETLVKIKATGAVPQQFEALKISYKGHSSSEAAYALKSEATLIDLLSAKYYDNSSRCYALVALGKIKSEAAVPQLIAILKEKSYEFRRDAAFALGEIKSEEAVAQLVDTLLIKDITQYDFHWRGMKRATATALGKIKSEAAVRGLLAAINDNNGSATRLSAARALIKIKPEVAVPYLITVLKDKRMFLYKDRAQAASTLGETKSNAAVQALLDVFNNADFYRPSSVDDLIIDQKVFLSRVDYIRFHIVYALNKIKSEVAVPHLIAALKENDALVRPQSYEALGKIVSEAAIQALLIALKDNDYGSKLAAVRGLGETRSEAAVLGLASALKDEKPYLRADAAKALGKMLETRE